MRLNLVKEFDTTIQEVMMEPYESNKMRSMQKEN